MEEGTRGLGPGDKLDLRKGAGLQKRGQWQIS